MYYCVGHNLRVFFASDKNWNMLRGDRAKFLSVLVNHFGKTQDILNKDVFVVSIGAKLIESFL